MISVVIMRIAEDGGVSPTGWGVFWFLVLVALCAK